MSYSWVLAVFWFVLGVVILYLDPPQFHFRLGEGTYSAGWAAFILAAYNFVRWWSYRSARDLRLRQEQDARRRKELHAAQEGPPPNPEFRLGDEPPRPGGP